VNPGEVRIETVETATGARALRIGGRLRLADGAEPWELLRRGLDRGAPVREIDVSEVTDLDGAGASWLLAARAVAARRCGEAVEFRGASGSVAKLLDLYGCPSAFSCLKSAPARVTVLDQVGRNTAFLFRGFCEVLDYTGAMVNAVGRALRRPASVHWADVPRLMERAGADGVPIVLLINFLVGLIVSLQAAGQLARFGANVFIADLVGLSMTRELAPLMTAILVAGRSGAAYAAEIGTMKVSEEIDALHTLGLDPQRFLVLPRVLALGAVVPLLTLLGMAVGVGGGLVIAVTQLDLTPLAFAQNLDRALRALDVVEGLSKSLVFAMLITFVACQRGLATRGGASGVGASTTSAVVTTIFHLVLFDAALSVTFNAIRG
jgi:phospholipid/cholesterol/gamma-HCH transport system permease protein